MATKKGSKSSKTAHVLNVLSSPKQEIGPEEEGVDQQTDGGEDSVQEAAPSRPVRVPILEVARANDDALSEQIRDLLEQDWMEEEDVTPATQSVPTHSLDEAANAPAQQPAPDDSQEAAVPVEEAPPLWEEEEAVVEPPAPPIVREAPREPLEKPRVSQEAPPAVEVNPIQPEAPREPLEQPRVSQEAPPAVEVNSNQPEVPREPLEQPRLSQETPPEPEVSSNQPEAPREPLEQPRLSQEAPPAVEVSPILPEAPREQPVEPVAEAPKEKSTQGDKSLPYLECQDEFCHVNIMQALVEEKSLKYIQMFGLCTCSRCVADVKALALSNLPPKYIVMHKGQVVPMLSVYEGRFSSALTAQIINACKVVMQNPRH